VVKTTVFLKNLDDFVAMNGVYGEVFAGHAPARSTVQVAKLPRDVLVEIEAIVSLACWRAFKTTQVCALYDYPE
jgi:2-iminobutanoate/2-iminopropanoate deaminase